MSFNVIVTLEPSKENHEWAFSQINSCVGASYVIVRVRPSLILLSVAEPYKFWFEVKKCIYGKDTPLHRVVPVDAVVDPLIDRIAEKAQQLALARIPENATYRVTLHGKVFTLDDKNRLIRIHSIDAIRVIAEKINRKVDLNNPEWVVYIRTINIRRWSAVTAISVAKNIVFKNIRVGEPSSPL
uniref:THUMP domain-containing protein n=1 Tax=Ignisphaera aggregans TaxID=334771 RepID=A0A7J2U2A9_9CREN